MIDCLAKLSGKNYAQNTEREELTNLRKKVEKFRKIVFYFNYISSMINMRKKFTVHLIA